MEQRLLAALLLFAVSSALAQVEVIKPWARATAPGQASVGVYMTLYAHNPSIRLVGCDANGIGSCTVHKMTMKGRVMRMHPIDTLPLPKNRQIHLKPGDHYHIMLEGLKQPLKAGATVPLTLKFQGAGKKIATQCAKVYVRKPTSQRR